MQVQDLGIDYLERRNDYIDAVTLEEARRVATVYQDGGRHAVDWSGDTTWVVSQRCTHFDSASAISFNPFNSREFVLRLSVLLRENVSVSVTLATPALSYNIVYTAVDELVKRK